MVGFSDTQIRRVICSDYHGSGARAFHPSEAQEHVIEENCAFLNNGRLSLPGEEVGGSYRACLLILSSGGRQRPRSTEDDNKDAVTHPRWQH